MKTFDQQLAFRAGFARGMSAISSGDAEAMRESILADHTACYSRGYGAALDHFAGLGTIDTGLAHDMSLFAAYDGFYGQLSFKHPLELPGHNIQL